MILFYLVILFLSIRKCCRLFSILYRTSSNHLSNIFGKHINSVPKYWVFVHTNILGLIYNKAVKQLRKSFLTKKEKKTYLLNKKKAPINGAIKIIFFGRVLVYTPLG